MNFLGLGFSFGGRDKGMSKTIENQTKHLGLMGNAVKTLDKILSINRLATFINALSLSRLKDISDRIENISSAGRNLTTDLESTFQSNSRTMAAFGVTVGKTGADLKKFKKETNSAAYETGISIDEMGKAFYGFEPAAQILTDLGIKGGKDFAKFAEVAGVDAQQFGWGVGQMSKQIGLSSEQMNLLISQATKFGQTTGTLGQTLNDLPQMAELFNARKALGDSPEAIANFGQQIFGLGDALFQAGVQDAGGFAKHLAKTMTDSKKSFKDLFAGVGDDLNSFHQELMVSGLDANKVFASMEQGPADFMKMMAEQVSMLEANGGDVGKALEFMRGRMSQTFGEEQTNQIVTALQDPVKRGAMAALKLETKATDALGNIVKEGYEGRFTLAEQFERSEAMMVHRFRQIGREETKQFVKSSQKAFKQFGDSLEKISKEKGPLGMLVRKMSEAHQIGAQAFIPEVMRPMVTLAGSAVKEMGPMLGILGSLGFRFGMLLNPVNLLLIAGGALIAWFVALRLQGKSTVEAVQSMGDTIANFVSMVPEYISRGLDAVIGFFKSFGKKAEKGGPDWGAMVGKWVAQISGAFKAAWPTIKEQLLTLGGMFMGWAKSVDWSGMAKSFLLNLIEGMNKGRLLLAEAVVSLVDWALKAIEDIDFGKLVGSLGNLLIDGVGLILSGLAPVVETLLARLPEFLMRVWDKILVLAKTLPKTLAGFLSGLGEKLKEVLPGLLKGVFKLILNLPGMILHMFVSLVEALPDILSGLWTLLKSAVGFVGDVLIGIVTGLMAAIDETFPGVGEFINGVVGYFTTLWDQIKYLWNEGKIWILAFWDDLKSWVQTSVDAVSSIMAGVIDDFTAPFVAIWDWVDKLFMHSISTWIQEDLDVALKFVENFGKLAGQAFDMVTSGLNALLPSSMQIGGGSDTKPVPAAAKPAPALGAEARDTSLVNAIHHPAWYARYEQVFANRMDALIKLTQAQTNATAKGGRMNRTAPRKGGRGGSPDDDTNLGLNLILAGDVVGG